MNLVLLSILGALNLWTLLAYGWDKRRATRGQDRTPESTLLLLAAVGGVVGAWLGVRLFRHKTRKRSFLIALVVASLVGVLAWWTLIDLFWQNDVAS